MTKLSLICQICLICLIGYFAPSAKAQSTTLSVSPPVVEILLAPNKKITQTFTLQTSGENLDITPELHLAIPSDSSGHMTINPDPIIPSSLPLAYSIETISHEPLTINLSLESASTDLPQDIYLALVFRASPSTINHQPSTMLTPAIAALILVTINPTGVMPVGLQIQDFEPPYFHDSWLPLTITPKIENKTDIMIRPQGKYEIISPSGKTVLDLPLYPNLILGQSSRRILGLHTRCEGSPHTGCVDPASPLTWIPKWSNLGPHRLRLTITTEGGTQITQVEKVIWILPIRIIIIVFLISFLLLTVILKHSKLKAV